MATVEETGAAGMERVGGAPVSERDVKEGLGSDEGGEDSGGVTLAVEGGAVGGSTVGVRLASGMGDIAGYLRGDCPLGAGRVAGTLGVSAEMLSPLTMS